MCLMFTVQPNQESGAMAGLKNDVWRFAPHVVRIFNEWTHVIKTFIAFYKQIGRGVFYTSIAVENITTVESFTASYLSKSKIADGGYRWASNPVIDSYDMDTECIFIIQILHKEQLPRVGGEVIAVEKRKKWQESVLATKQRLSNRVVYSDTKITPNHVRHFLHVFIYS